MIAGFERPDSGQILLDGHDMAQQPPHLRPVNTVFQNYALFPLMTVRDNVAFGLRYQDVPKSDDRPPRRRGPRAGPDRRARQAPALPAVRRPAAARRPGPGPGAQPPGAAARRAARRPRRPAAQAPPAPAAPAPARARHHVRLRHPRPGGSAHHERPHRGDRRRQGRAGRLTRGDLRASRDGVRRGVPGLGQHLRRRRHRRLRHAWRPARPWAAPSPPRSAATPRAARRRSSSAPSASRSATSRPRPRPVTTGVVGTVLDVVYLGAVHPGPRRRRREPGAARPDRQPGRAAARSRPAAGERVACWFSPAAVQVLRRSDAKLPDPVEVEIG